MTISKGIKEITKTEWDNCPVGQMSQWDKCPVGQMSGGQMSSGTVVQWDKCPVGQLSVGQLSHHLCTCIIAAVPLIRLLNCQIACMALSAPLSRYKCMHTFTWNILFLETYFFLYYNKIIVKYFQDTLKVICSCLI